MNATYVQRGEYIDFTPESNVKAGDVVVLGRLALVSKLDIKAGTLGALATTGVYDVAKGGEAFAAGDRVYWDAAGARAVREGGAVLGVCILDADEQAPTVRVILRGGGGGSAAAAGGTQGGGQGGAAAEPSAPIADVTLRSVTGNGSLSGGDGNSNVAADLTGIRDAVNAVLAALRSHGIVEDD
jgi:predicted RecA/RadA family phage recombinase